MTKKTQPDKAEKMLQDYPDVFADIINVLVFGGLQVVVPERLVDAPTEAFYKAEEGNMSQKNRDIVKIDTENDLIISVYALENQTKVSNVMPVRVIGYDAASYDFRIKRLKAANEENGIIVDFAEEIKTGQKICPVITLVLYYGNKEWYGPTSLRQMLQVPEALKGRLSDFVPDYPINLIQVANLSRDTIDLFKSDFYIVAEYFRVKKLGKMDELRYNKRRIKHVEETLEFLRIFTNEKRFSEIKGNLIGISDGGGVRMCEVVDYFVNEGRLQGLNQGRTEGRAEGKFESLLSLLENGFEMEDAAKILKINDQQLMDFNNWLEKTSALQ